MSICSEAYWKTIFVFCKYERSTTREWRWFSNNLSTSARLLLKNKFRGNITILKNQIGSSSLLLRQYKDQLTSLSPIQKEIAIGLYLGDPSLQRQSKISHQSFSFLANLFLNESRKKRILPGLIRDHLTDRGLAYWYMDDGGLASKGRFATNFHTQNFEFHEVRRLCEECFKKFALDCWPKKNKKGFCIVISGKSSITLWNRIHPWVIESMRYKFRTRENSVKKRKKLENKGKIEYPMQQTNSWNGIRSRWHSLNCVETYRKKG